jgi:electron transport complex protein RnfC
MMGFAVCNLETPVTKGTSGILALTHRECRRSAQTACIQCGRCIEVCPIGLQPTKLFKNIEHMEYKTALDLGLMDCKECGCCGYICPANLPLVQSMRLGKAMAKKRKK